MNKHELQSISSSDLLDLLNKKYQDKAEFVINQFQEGSQTEHFDSLCADCHHQTVQKRSGDEGWTWCESCQMTEGKTVEITIVKPLKVAYVWNTKHWIPESDEIGCEL